MKAYPAYKPSGVPWLGDVPGHWDAKCLKRLGLFRAGAGFPVDRQGQAGNALPFFKVKDIDGANVGGYLHDTDSSISYEDAKSLGAKVFPHTTIVFAKVGAALLLNRFRLLGCEACIDNNMMGFVLDADLVHPEFARWAMHRINFAELVNPGTVPSLNEPQIANIQIALPPSIAEQQVIADYLDTETARFDELIREKEGLIGLLREHSQGVVSDAVVRGLRRDCSVKGWRADSAPFRHIGGSCHSSDLYERRAGTRQRRTTRRIGTARCRGCRPRT